MREEVLNVALASALTNRGLDARAEVILPGRHLPDVLIDHEGVRIIIEARSNRSNLTRDAAARVSEGIASVGVALLYPPILRETETDLGAAMERALLDIVVAYFGSDGIQLEERQQISLDELTAIIRAAIHVQVNENVVATQVERVRDCIDEIVKDSLRTELKNPSRAVATRLAKVLGLKSRDKAPVLTDELLRIALFILFDALIFQDAVAQRHAQISFLSLDVGEGRRAYLIEQWRGILRIDYEPIYRLALDILEGLPNDAAWNHRLNALSRSAIAVRASGVLAKHDFLGRLFHRILLRTSGEAYATYYTAIPSAYLLARISIGMMNLELSSAERAGDLRIADLACGSGTLLSAAYIALRDRYVTTATEPLNLDLLHRSLIEKTIFGLDVLDYASHLTLVTLALHQANSEITDNNIFRVPAGAERGHFFLGSLELFNDFLTGVSFGHQETHASLDGRQRRRVVLPDFDLVIMNPPFSRSSKPKSKFAYDAPNAKNLNLRLKGIARDQGFKKIGIAGLPAFFIPLALRYLKDGGRIAFVLQRSMLSGVSWAEIRDLVTRSCHLEVVVSNHDPGRATGPQGSIVNRKIPSWCFSEETTVGEVLLIARKRKAREPLEKTTFLNLFRYPQNEFEAIAVSSDTLSALQSGAPGRIRYANREVASVQSFAQSALGKNWLAGALFSLSELNSLVFDLARNSELRSLSSAIATDGCDISAEKQMFLQADVPTPFRILWTHGIAQNTIALSDNHVDYGSARKGLDTADGFYKRHRARLLLAERPQLFTKKTFAIYSESPILATPFWELNLIRPDLELALATWFNSTLGILMYLRASTSSYGEIFKLKKDQFDNVLIPSDEQLEALAKIAPKFANMPLDNLQTSWRNAAVGAGTRFELDRIVARTLNIEELSPEYYRLLATEPSVCNVAR